MKLKLHHIIPYALATMGVLSIGWWVVHDPVADLSKSIPGMDNRGEGNAVELEVIIGEHFASFTDESKPRNTDEHEKFVPGELLPGESSASLTESWPRFRGAQFDNISRSKVSLLERFPEDGPRQLWSVELGEGHGGAAIWKGKVYILDYDEELRSDMLRCFDLVTGQEVWRRWYKIPVKRNHGMSRTVPAINEQYILTIGPRGHVMCVERETGDFLWGLDVEKTYGTEVPFWYTGQCPLMDDGKAILASGGTTLLLAVDCATGETVWETPNEAGLDMSHSSVVPYTFQGTRMYVYSAIGGVCGVAADGPEAGKLLWISKEWQHNVVAPSPVCLPDGTIFLTAGYGAGSMVLKLSESSGVFSTEVLQEYSPREGLACEQQTPVIYEGHLLGILPKDAGGLRNQLVCVHPDDFTAVKWSSGPTVRFGLGPYLIADNKLFILSDNGTLTIAKPSTVQYNQLDSYRVIPDGGDAWAPIAVADGYMVLRDSKKMICLDMAEKRRNYE